MVDLAADAAPGASGAAESPAWVAVAGLGKSFAGGTRALHEVSFAARPGEVLGLLGENGAGKTTALRILAGYLKPSAGTAQVAGFDVVDEPLAARAQVGYLPEQVPLPRELRVREYLRYRAELKGVTAPRRALDSLLDEVLAAVGLEREQRRLLAQLSKGYRQRVGLAQALLHQPSVLILDEPTSGLDPNQILAIRNLIRRIGESRTVILSTHILQEVQATCDRVVIIHEGQIVADAPTERIQAQEAGGALIKVSYLPGSVRLGADAVVAGLGAIPGVTRVEKQAAMDEGELAFEVLASRDVRSDLFRYAVEQGLVLSELVRERSTLEEVFRRLTVRDAA